MFTFTAVKVSILAGSSSHNAEILNTVATCVVCLVCNDAFRSVCTSEVTRQIVSSLHLKKNKLVRWLKAATTKTETIPASAGTKKITRHHDNSPKHLR